MGEDEWAKVKALWNEYAEELKRLPFLQYQRTKVMSYTDGIFEITKPRIQPMPLPTSLLFDFDRRWGGVNPCVEIDLPIAAVPYPVKDPDGLDPETEVMARAHDDHFWPHRNGCPLCGSDAYVGFVRVECSNGNCGNFVHREGM